MEKMIAYCGVDCLECGAYQSTQNNDHDKRIETARIWSKIYKADIKPDEIKCEGCQSKNGVHFKHCQVCEVRKCCQEKGFDHCGLCDQYPCTSLETILKMVPEARRNLEARIK